MQGNRPISKKIFLISCKNTDSMNSSTCLESPIIPNLIRSIPIIMTLKAPVVTTWLHSKILFAQKCQSSELNVLNIAGQIKTPYLAQTIWCQALTQNRKPRSSLEVLRRIVTIMPSDNTVAQQRPKDVGMIKPMKRRNPKRIVAHSTVFRLETGSSIPRILHSAILSRYDYGLYVRKIDPSYTRFVHSRPGCRGRRCIITFRVCQKCRVKLTSGMFVSCGT